MDGNTNGNYQSGLVATTNNEAQAWWRVDLGTTAAVGSVEVWNRTDCCPERLSNFNVMLLDANQATVASINVPVQAGTPTTVQISGTARYVKVQLVGTNFLSLAEVKVWSAPASNINWLVTDQLGTPRMIFDKTGSLANVKRHDYLPFGEEIFAGTGSRTTTQGYPTSPNSSDGVRQKFTQKERDNETGLDYFNARYYSSTAGRFTSTDPIFISDKQTYNPQLWNLYNYVGNNPLNATDPTGMELVQLGQHTNEEIDKRRKAIDEEKKAIRKDPSLTKAQQDEKRGKLEAEKQTLGLEKEGNRVVGQELASLQAHGELNGLKLGDFTLSTDSKHDFDADPRVSDDPGGGAGMFTLGGYSTQIYVNAKSRDYNGALSGDADYITYGGTAGRHEQVHRDGDVGGDKSEHAAYTVQLRILQKYGPAAFKTRDFYDTAIDHVRAGTKRKD